MFFDLFGRLPSIQQPLAAMVLRSMWKRRNVKLWQGDDSSPHITVTRAKDTLNELRLYAKSKISNQQYISPLCMDQTPTWHSKV